MVELELGKFRAAIFDMDGTMVDTTPSHKNSFEVFFKRYGIPFSEEYFNNHIIGRKNSDIFPEIFPKKSKPELEGLIYEKEAIFREIGRNEIREVKGLTSLIRRLIENGIILSIASTASKENREFFLNITHLSAKIFSVIVGDEEVSEGKPSPEIYLKAAKRLGVKPQDCIVFEDSTSGIRAGKYAGMIVIAVATNKMPETLKEADYIIQDFTEVNLV